MFLDFLLNLFKTKQNEEVFSASYQLIKAEQVELNSGITVEASTSTINTSIDTLNTQVSAISSGDISDLRSEISAASTANIAYTDSEITSLSSSTQTLVFASSANSYALSNSYTDSEITSLSSSTQTLVFASSAYSYTLSNTYTDSEITSLSSTVDTLSSALQVQINSNDSDILAIQDDVTNIAGTSGEWNTVYSQVCANSAEWVGGGGAAGLWISGYSGSTTTATLSSQFDIAIAPALSANQIYATSSIELPSAGVVLLGQNNVEGTWQIAVSAGNLGFFKYESGVYNLKGSFTS